jgi:hypothetical protein
MKARNENGAIKIYPTLPNVWKNVLNFEQADAETLQAEGFYELYRPTINAATQKLGELYFDEEYEVYTYQVIEKTQAEINYETAINGWHHPEFEKRIIAPALLLNEYPAIGVHMMINKLPIEPSEDGNTLYLYMTVIKSEHQALVDSLQGVLTIENVPTL